MLIMLSDNLAISWRILGDFGVYLVNKKLEKTKEKVVKVIKR